MASKYLDKLVLLSNMCFHNVEYFGKRITNSLIVLCWKYYWILIVSVYNYYFWMKAICHKLRKDFLLANSLLGVGMRRFLIFFLLLSFVVTTSINSKEMLEVEQGSVHTESSNLNHTRNSLSEPICSTTKKYIELPTPTLNHNHSHLILLDSIALDKGYAVSYLKNQIRIARIFFIQFNLYSVPLENPPLSFHPKLEFLSSNCPQLLQFTVLIAQHNSEAQSYETAYSWPYRVWVFIYNKCP